MNGSEGCSEALSENTSTMNFVTIYADVPAKSSPRETSSESGTSLREHDYIRLSDVSSANSSDDKHSESGQSQVLDLNESATVLRLGPPAAPKPDAKKPVRDAREPELAKPIFGGSQRNNAILEEFRKEKAMKAAAQHAPCAQMMRSANPNLPVYQRPTNGYEVGPKGGFPIGFHAPYNVFPGVKNNGVKRGFSETVGMPLTAQGHCDGMGMGRSEQPDVKVSLQQGKTWMSNVSHSPYNVPRRALVQDVGETSNKVSNEAKKHILNIETIIPASNDQFASPA